MKFGIYVSKNGFFAASAHTFSALTLTVPGNRIRKFQIRRQLNRVGWPEIRAARKWAARLNCPRPLQLVLISGRDVRHHRQKTRHRCATLLRRLGRGSCCRPCCARPSTHSCCERCTLGSNRTRDWSTLNSRHSCAGCRPDWSRNSGLSMPGSRCRCVCHSRSSCSCDCRSKAKPSRTCVPSCSSTKRHNCCGSRRRCSRRLPCWRRIPRRRSK
jgi:hypothetical protein